MKYYNYLIEIKFVRESVIPSLRYLAVRAPIVVIGGIFAYMMFTSALFSRQQYWWFAAYTLIIAAYPTYVEIVENIISKAIEDDNP